MRTGSPSPSHFTTSMRLWMSSSRSASTWLQGRMVRRAVSRCMAPRSHPDARRVHAIRRRSSLSSPAPCALGRQLTQPKRSAGSAGWVTVRPKAQGAARPSAPSSTSGRRAARMCTGTAATALPQPPARHGGPMTSMGHGPDVFGNALRHVRRTYLLSQRALAARLGVPHSRISRLESGHHGVTLETAISLYRTLGFDIGLVHTFACPQSDEVKPRCHDWDDDGAVGNVDAAMRAFPAHAAVGPGVPTWWGVPHGWGASDREDLWWFRDYRSPPVLRARQDGRMSDSDDVRATSEITEASEAAAAYAAVRPEIEAATALFVEMVTGLLDDAGINYLSVSGRTKSVASFASKAERRDENGLLYPDPLVDITDQIGVRVITYVHDDVAAVAELLAEELAVLDDRDMGLETARAGRFGYASRHLLVSVDASRTVPPAYETLRRLSASVQIRTVLQHAWAEFEHDIRYKGTIPEEHAHELDRRFTLAAGLLELADREFSQIRDQLQATVTDQRTE